MKRPIAQHIERDADCDTLSDMKLLRFSSLLVGIAAFSGMGKTCCTAYRDDAPIKLVGENAIILWDAEAKREHFIRQASFEGEAKDFGFIVPTPGKPEVAEADEEAFKLLAALVPKPATRASGSLGNDSVAAEAGPVNVIEQYQVGDYAVSVLQAKDGKSILDWLKTNGYTNRPAMEDWLDYYAQMGWYFAALKFSRAQDSKTPETKALRVSFDAGEPFYPYKMPSDTWPSGHFRPMSLYFVSYGVARATYRGTNKGWEANVKWSGALPRSVATKLAKAIDLDVTEIPPDATVTVFENTSNAQGYDRDLKFATYTSILPTWAIVLVLGGGTVAVFYTLATRKKAA